MAGSNKSNGGNIVGLITTVAGAAVALAPVADKVADGVKTRLPQKPDKKEQVVIPALYDKGFPLELGQAIELLESFGLKVIPSKLSLREANAKYRDYFDCQVVDSKPKQKQKITEGSPIIVKYITQDVIDESQRIFDEAERQASELKRIKADKRALQKEHTHKIISKAADKAKAGICKIIPHQNKQGKDEGL